MAIEIETGFQRVSGETTSLSLDTRLWYDRLNGSIPFSGEESMILCPPSTRFARCSSDMRLDEPGEEKLWKLDKLLEFAHDFEREISRSAVLTLACRAYDVARDIHRYLVYERSRQQDIREEISQLRRDMRGGRSDSFME